MKMYVKREILLLRKIHINQNKVHKGILLIKIQSYIIRLIMLQDLPVLYFKHFQGSNATFPYCPVSEHQELK